MKSLLINLLVLCGIFQGTQAQENFVFESYQGVKLDHNLIYQLPNYNYCLGVEESLLDICQLGVKAATEQARSHLDSYGSLQGFWAGYSQGLRNGILQTRVSEQSLQLAKSKVDLKHPFLVEKIQDHINHASLFGLHEGKNRFQKFISSVLTSDGHQAMPEPKTFSLSNNSMQTDEKIDPPQIKLLDDISKNYLKIFPPEIETFFSKVNYYGKNQPPNFWVRATSQFLKPSLISLWANGQINHVFEFDKSTWNDKEQAYRFFVEGEALSAGWSSLFEKLGPRELRAFKQGFQGTDTSSSYRVGVNLVDNAHRFGAYELYARYEFAKFFNSFVEIGYKQGLIEGREMGIELGALEILPEQTDLAYMKESIKRYSEEFIDQYRRSFQQEYRSRLRAFRPIIEQVEIIGEFDDEEEQDNPIHQPLERFKLRVTVSNLGFNEGKSVPMSLSIMGEGLEPLSSEPILIAPLSRRAYVTSQYIGRISKVDFGKTLSMNVQLTTTSTEFDADPFKLNLTVKNIVRIGSVEHLVNIEQGFIEADIFLENISSSQSEDKDLQLELFIDGEKMPSASSDLLTKSMTPDNKPRLSMKLMVFYLDSLKLLKGQYYFEIHLKRNNQLIQKLNYDLNVVTTEKIKQTVDFAEATILGNIRISKNYQSLYNPMHIIFDDLVSWVVDLSTLEIRNINSKENPYRNDLDKDDNQTIVGALWQMKQRLSKDSTDYPRDYMSHFEPLVCSLEPLIKDIPAGKGRRRIFKKILKNMIDGKSLKKSCYP